MDIGYEYKSSSQFSQFSDLGQQQSANHTERAGAEGRRSATGLQMIWLGQITYHMGCFYLRKHYFTFVKGECLWHPLIFRLMRSPVLACVYYCVIKFEQKNKQTWEGRWQLKV